MLPAPAIRNGVRRMRADVIKLISRGYEKNEYGVERPVETERLIYCHVGGITRSEFFEAGRNGLNPDFVFYVFFGDYNGESICEYNGKRYAVYRTYNDSVHDRMELYVQREGGTNG